MKRKAQAFVQDMAIAIAIITMVMILYFGFYQNQAIDDENKYRVLVSEAKTVSDYLVSAGYPEDWNSSSVAIIGLTNGKNVLDMTKLDEFSNLTTNDYDRTRSLLKTKYDYIVFFRDYNSAVLNMTGKSFYGKSGVNNTNIDSQSPAHLTTIHRFVVENQGTANITSRIIEMVVYVWTEQK